MYDTAGNVYEWAEDDWHESYEGAPTDGSAWEDEGTGSRVLRGGSWGDEPRGCRAANRLSLTPDDRLSFIGFRVCCGAPIE
ncbi:MAG: formylglycine-generating enzyme family protein [Acidobacteria bacterium]|nr:formylglycine-generating enzyme family protein [Acidobacteriota bacterium]